MALGPELVINGDFLNGSDDWTLAPEWTVSNEELNCNAPGTAVARQYFGLPLNTQMRVVITLRNYASGSVRMKIAPIDYIEMSANDTYTWDTLGDNTNTDIQIISNAGVGFVGSIDDVSIKEILPTTTVEIEWIDSISAAATGNKIYRDDVEIADIANGVQIYQDDTAETGTEYKYEVQAYSATDETTQEVLGVNVQFITTA